MGARLLFVNPDVKSHRALEILRNDGVECVELNSNLSDLLQYMLGGDDVLWLCASEIAHSSMLETAGTFLQIVSYDAAKVESSDWSVMPANLTPEQEAEFLLGFVQRGSEGRRRTRIPLNLQLWVKGAGYRVTNASVKELWVETDELDDRQRFDGVLELDDAYGTVPVHGRVVARRHDGCAVNIQPSQDLGLLLWLDYFSDVLSKTPENERIELVREYFGDK